MKINSRNLMWAILHPAKTVRYVQHRDRIPYGEIAKYIPENPVILEAGAANGDNTVEMAAFWPKSTIHAFEPVPGTKAILDSKIGKFGSRIQSYPFALGDEPGTFTLHISGEGDANSTQSSSLLEPTGHHTEYDFVKFGDTAEVEVLRLEDWSEREGVDHIDFMWLDMQGFELRALSGATSLLKKVSAIQIEVQHTELYAGAPLYPEVRKWMLEHGFKPKLEAIFRIGGNVLFTRS